MPNLKVAFVVCWFFVRYTQPSPVLSAYDVWPLNAVSNPNDFGWISKWSAIGDSYAAGIGAGSSPQSSEDRQCSRYGDAYPYLLNDLMENDNAEFKFLPCAGVGALIALEIS